MRTYVSSKDLKDKYGLKATSHKKTDTSRSKPKLTKKDDGSPNIEPEVSRVTSRQGGARKSHSTKSHKIQRTTAPTAPSQGQKYSSTSAQLNGNAAKHKRVKSMEGVEGEPRLMHNFGSVMSLASGMNGGKMQKLPPVRKSRTNSESYDDSKRASGDNPEAMLLNDPNDHLYDEIFDKKAKMLERMITKINMDQKGRKVDANNENGMHVKLDQKSNKTCDDEVVRWLQTLRLPSTDRYVSIFAENHVVDMDGVLHLTEKQLKDMGVSAMGTVTKMMRNIREMRRAQTRQGGKIHKFQPTVKRAETSNGLYSQSADSFNLFNSESVTRSTENLGGRVDIPEKRRQSEWKLFDSQWTAGDNADIQEVEGELTPPTNQQTPPTLVAPPPADVAPPAPPTHSKPLLTSKSKSMAKLFTPREELESGGSQSSLSMAPAFHTSCARSRRAPSRTDDLRSTSRLQDHSSKKPSSKQHHRNGGNANAGDTKIVNGVVFKKHKTHGGGGGKIRMEGQGEGSAERSQSAVPTVRGRKTTLYYI